MGGRPPKPNNLLELSGAFAKNPQRYAARKSNPLGPLGRPPAHWLKLTEAMTLEKSAELIGVWREVSRVAPWLTCADRFAVEDICVLRVKARGTDIKSSERSITLSLMTACGLTPAGRMRINTDPVAPKGGQVIDPRDAFDQARPR
jgi:hypothetical protein